MSTYQVEGALVLLLGKTRFAILSLLFFNSGNAYYFRQIVREAGVAVGAAQRELRLLTGVGLITQVLREGRSYYKANGDSPLFSEIRDLVARGVETADVAKIPVPGNKIRAFCRRNHVKKLSFFGSVLRRDFGPDSDVDVLAEFEEGKTPGLFAMSALEQELSSLMAGRKIDLRTPADLSRLFRGQVVKESKVIYDVSGR